MSSKVKCECCGKVGRRRMGRMAPEGWLYLEAIDEEEGPSSTIVVWACSRGCAMGLWREGPGKLNLTEGPTPAQQAARERVLANAASRGVVPTTEEVQAVLDELGDVS